MKKQWFFFIALLVFVLAACAQTPKDQEAPRNDVNENIENEGNMIEEQKELKEQDSGIDENLNEDKNFNQNDKNNGQSTNGKAMKDGDTNFKLSPEDAYDVYLKTFPNTKVREVKLDHKRNTYVYQIEGFDAEKEYEVNIDPNSGEVLADKSKNKPNNHQEIPKEILKNVPNLVSEALVDAGEGAMLDEWEVAYDNGMNELDIEIDLADGRDVDYKYNLDTGELIKKD